MTTTIIILALQFSIPMSIYLIFRSIDIHYITREEAITIINKRNPK